MKSEDLPRSMKASKSDRPLRIGFVYSRLPFPMMRGDQLTVAHLLSFLSARGHSVDFYTLRTDGKLSPMQQEWLEKICSAVRVYPHGPIRAGFGMLSALLRGWPLQIGYFQNRNLNEDVRRAIAAGKYDIVYTYYLRSAPAIPHGFAPNTPTIILGKRIAAFLAMQLSQTLNTRRIYQHQSNRAKKLLYLLEWKLLERYESRVWKNFTKCVLIGPSDVAALKQSCEAQNVSTITNWIYGAHGTDTDKFRPAAPSDVVPNRIVFSGSMLYEPNVQAIEWFVDNCWPQIKRRVKGAELFIVGKDPVPSVIRLGEQEGINVTGTVPDIGEYIRSASVCINPMRAAGGMQNKLIEYMASAKAIVATSVANEGVNAPDGTMVLRDASASFAEAVCELLEDSARANALGYAARDYVQKAWTWEAHFEALEEAFHAALSNANQIPY